MTGAICSCTSVIAMRKTCLVYTAGPGGRGWMNGTGLFLVHCSSPGLTRTGSSANDWASPDGPISILQLIVVCLWVFVTQQKQTNTFSIKLFCTLALFSYSVLLEIINLYSYDSLLWFLSDSHLSSEFLIILWDPSYIFLLHWSFLWIYQESCHFLLWAEKLSTSAMWHFPNINLHL